jgi:hypothetical protein
MRPAGLSLASILLRVAILIALLVLATLGAHMIRDALNLEIRPDNEQQGPVRRIQVERGRAGP